jgi:hypothetical protein
MRARTPIGTVSKVLEAEAAKRPQPVVYINRLLLPVVPKILPFCSCILRGTAEKIVGGSVCGYPVGHEYAEKKTPLGGTQGRH